MDRVRTSSRQPSTLFPFPVCFTDFTDVTDLIACSQQHHFAYTNRLNWATGTLQFPGGHLEVGEDYLECAERETLEETGLKVKAVKALAFTNDIFDAEKKHYITIFVSCRRNDEQKQPVVSLCQPVVHPLEEFVR